MAQQPPDAPEAPEAPAAARYWEQALARFSEESRKKIQEIADPQQVEAERQDQTSWPEQLLKACQESRDKYKEKKWKVTISGNDIILDQLWNTVIETLNRVKSLGDVAASTEPMAGLGWSIAKLFLQIPVEKAKVACSVVEGMEKVLIVMSRGLVYEREIRDSCARDESSIKTFEGFLIDLYEQTLIFLFAVSSHYNASIITRTWRSVWNPDAITSFDKKTVQIQSDLQDEASTGFRIGVRGDLLVVLQSQKSLKEQLSRLQGGVTKSFSEIIQKQEKQRLEREKNENRHDVLRWLSQLPYLDHHKTAKRGRVAQTAQWIFERSEFIGWLRSQNQEVLWIHGIPGAGKTKLISTIVDRFHPKARATLNIDGDTFDYPESDVERRQLYNDSQVAFFYCRRDNDKRRDCVQILRSIIKQLALSCDPFPNSVQDLYESRGLDDSPSQEVEVEDCQTMLEAVINCHEQVLLILDALDECPESSRTAILGVIDDLMKRQTSKVKVKVVITSREEVDISKCLLRGKHVGISAMDNSDDIVTFVEKSIANFKETTNDDERDTPLIPAELEEKITTVFRQKSGAMFQWAAVHLEFLLSRPTSDAIEDALTRTPHDIKAAYAEVFAAIKATEDWGDIAMRAFTWLHAVGGSISAKVLAAAASQKLEGMSAWSRSLLETEQVLKACQNLVVVNEDSVRFSHLSVEEYFEQEEARDCQEFAATVCLRTLLYYDTETKSGTDKNQALWDYAYHNWWSHVQASSNKQDIQVLVERFLGSHPPSPACARWLSRLSRDALKSALEQRAGDEQFGAVSRPIYRPQRWLTPVELCRPRMYRRPPEDHQATMPYQLLVLEPLVSGCFTFAKLALASSVHPEEWPGPQETCAPMRLHRQPSPHDIEPREQLLNLYRETKKVNGLFAWLMILSIYILLAASWPLLSRPQQLMAIQWAGIPERSEGQEEEATVPVDSNRVKDIESLEEILNVLRGALDYGLVVRNHNLQRHNYDDLLEFFRQYNETSPKCLKEVARVTLVLLCKLDDMSGAKEELINYLFEKFELDSPPEYQYLRVPNLELSPLLVTADYVYELRIVKFLVQNGADVDFVLAKGPKESRYGTALVAAVASDCTVGAEIVEFLLQKITDVNKVAASGEFGTALIAACALGRVDAVNLLLQRPDIDVNITTSTGIYKTALIAACATNHVSITNLLLNKAANARLVVEDDLYGTPMAAALSIGNARLVYMLCNFEAPVNDTLKNSMPQELSTAIKRWEFFTDEVYAPVVEKFSDNVEECVKQCTMAAKQLSVALIYDQLGVPMEWADQRRQKAVRCLKLFSSDGAHDFRAAEAWMQFLGYEHVVQLLKIWRADWRASAHKMELEGWKGLSPLLLELIGDLEKGQQQQRLERVRTLGSSLFQDDDMAPYGDSDEEGDEGFEESENLSNGGEEES